MDITDIMLTKQNQQQPTHQRQIRTKLIEANLKILNTDLSMSDSMTGSNKNGNITDESAMDMVATDEGDSITN